MRSAAGNLVRSNATRGERDEDEDAEGATETLAFGDGCSLAQLASHVGRRASRVGRSDAGDVLPRGGVELDRSSSVNGIASGENDGSPIAGVGPLAAARLRFGERRRAESPTVPNTPSTSSFHWFSSERNPSPSSLLRRRAPPIELRLKLRLRDAAAFSVVADPSRTSALGDLGERVTESIEVRDLAGEVGTS